jgi:hypothetical protein
MTINSCCGTTPRDISIGLSESTLAFVYCERCESRQWFRDGQPVSLTSVKEHASTEWNKSARSRVAVSA